MLRVITLTLALLLSGNLSLAQSCARATIMSPTPFMGNDGEIFRLDDGTIWQIKYAQQYFYAYYPNVVICPSRQQMTVKGKSLNVELLSSTPAGVTGVASRKLPPLIESRIDGPFEGWSGETIFKLENGQIWQQASYANAHSRKYRPKVVIVRTGAGYEMQVDGLPSRLRVQLLQ
jgi:hypothetical protein